MPDTNTIICTNDSPIWCSIVPDTAESKAAFYNMSSAPCAKISALINQHIRIANIYCEMTQGTDRDTGEIWTAPRVVLQTDDGQMYSATSYGIFKACQRLVSIFGPAPWPDGGIPVQVVQYENGPRRVLSLRADF